MMFLGVNTKENPMIFCGKSLAAQMEPARTLAGVFPGLFTTKAFPSQLKYSMWKWNAVGENRRSKILTSFGRCSQCGVGWNSYLKIYLVCVWGDIVWMRIGPKCMSIFGKNGGKRILETKSIHPANPLVFASHTLPMGMKGKPQEKQLSWSRVFSLPSAGWGLTTPPCLGFWLELVRNFFSPQAIATWSSKRWECRRVFVEPQNQYWSLQMLGQASAVDSYSPAFLVLALLAKLRCVRSMKTGVPKWLIFMKMALRHVLRKTLFIVNGNADADILFSWTPTPLQGDPWW